MKEIRQGCEFLLLSTMLRMLSVRIDVLDVILREQRRESLAFVSYWFKEVLVSTGIDLSIGQKMPTREPGAAAWPSIMGSMNSTSY